MKEWLVEKLICPECRRQPVPLGLYIEEKISGDIISGCLNCPECRSQYPIKDGIAVVVPQTTLATVHQNNGYNSPGMLSAYLWSHFGDLLNETYATDAYRMWADSFQVTGGDALDVGCSVGRLSMELARTHQHVIGIDTSLPFIKKAREIVNRKRLDFDLIIEGHLTESRRYDFNEALNFEGIEFMVADALALPFRQTQFASVAAINILEKVPDPLKHLQEVNRVMKPQAATFLFSDPFSWDEKVSSPEHWLGGNGNGRYSRRGIDTIRRIFAGEFGIFTPPLSLQDSGDVSWKIRKTENLWEHITSQFLVGHRA